MTVYEILSALPDNAITDFIGNLNKHSNLPQEQFTKILRDFLGKSNPSIKNSYFSIETGQPNDLFLNQLVEIIKSKNNLSTLQYSVAVTCYIQYYSKSVWDAMVILRIIQIPDIKEMISRANNRIENKEASDEKTVQLFKEILTIEGSQEVERLSQIIPIDSDEKNNVLPYFKKEKEAFILNTRFATHFMLLRAGLFLGEEGQIGASELRAGESANRAGARFLELVPYCDTATVTMLENIIKRLMRGECAKSTGEHLDNQWIKNWTKLESLKEIKLATPAIQKEENIPLAHPTDNEIAKPSLRQMEESFLLNHPDCLSDPQRQEIALFLQDFHSIPKNCTIFYLKIISRII